MHTSISLPKRDLSKLDKQHLPKCRLITVQLLLFQEYLKHSQLFGKHVHSVLTFEYVSVAMMSPYHRVLIMLNANIHTSTYLPKIHSSSLLI